MESVKDPTPFSLHSDAFVIYKLSDCPSQIENLIVSSHKKSLKKKHTALDSINHTLNFLQQDSYRFPHRNILHSLKLARWNGPTLLVVCYH